MVNDCAGGPENKEALRVQIQHNALIIAHVKDRILLVLSHGLAFLPKFFGQDVEKVR